MILCMYSTCNVQSATKDVCKEMRLTDGQLIVTFDGAQQMKNVPAASAVDMTKFRRLELGLCLAMMRETAQTIRYNKTAHTEQNDSEVQWSTRCRHTCSLKIAFIHYLNVCVARCRLDGNTVCQIMDWHVIKIKHNNTRSGIKKTPGKSTSCSVIVLWTNMAQSKSL